MRVTGAARRRIATLGASGTCDAEAVVEDATPRRSVLHPFFDWDDGSAAHKHRLQEARRLIRSVTIEVTTKKGVIRAVPVYVRDPTAGHRSQGYAVVSMMTDRDEKVRALQAAARLAEGHLDRVHRLAIALGLEHEFDKVLVQFDEFLNKMR